MHIRARRNPHSVESLCPCNVHTEYFCRVVFLPLNHGYKRKSFFQTHLCSNLLKESVLSLRVSPFVTQIYWIIKTNRESMPSSSSYFLTWFNRDQTITKNTCGSTDPEHRSVLRRWPLPSVYIIFIQQHQHLLQFPHCSLLKFLIARWLESVQDTQSLDQPLLEFCLHCVSLHLGKTINLSLSVFGWFGLHLF